MDILIADNTHEIVIEKLEKYKAHLAAIDRKKNKELSKKDKNGKARGLEKELGKSRDENEWEQAAEEEEDEEEAERRRRQVPKLVLCTTQTKYRVIKKACRKLDYRLNDDENADWDLYWADTGIQPMRI